MTGSPELHAKPESSSFPELKYLVENTSPMKPFLPLILLIALFFNACQQASEVSERTTIPEDGMYLIERTGYSEAELLPLSAHEQIIRFNEEFLEKTDQEEVLMVINTSEFCPLLLKREPVTQTQEDQRKTLFLTLTDDVKEQLQDFTTRNLKRQTAIVVNGQALTKHQIKMPIVSGMLQITRCTDNACEMLYVELQDNVIDTEESANQ